MNTLSPEQTFTRVLDGKREAFWQEYQRLRDDEQPAKCWCKVKSDKLLLFALNL